MTHFYESYLVLVPFNFGPFRSGIHGVDSTHQSYSVLPRLKRAVSGPSGVWIPDSDDLRITLKWFKVDCINGNV